MSDEELMFDEHESEKIEKYIENVYSARVPPPEQPTENELSFWNLVGIKATLFTVSALGAVVFSSIRTGGYFYIVETVLLKKFNIDGNLTTFLALASFVTALVAFEGYLLADGFSKGERAKDVTSSLWGVVSAFTVILVVGIFSSIEIASIPDDVKNILAVVSAILTAISSATISFFGGENIGFAVNEFRQRKQKIVDNYQEKYNKWRESAANSYLAVKRNFSKNFKNEKDMKNNQDNFNSEKEKDDREKEFQTWFKSLTKLEQAEYLVKKYYETNNDLPNSTEVSKSGIAISYCAHAINKFIVENKEELLSKNIITQEKAIKAEENYKNSQFYGRK